MYMQWGELYETTDEQGESYFHSRLMTIYKAQVDYARTLMVT